jgi:hypothetical protein
VNQAESAIVERSHGQVGFAKAMPFQESHAFGGCGAGDALPAPAQAGKDIFGEAFAGQ